MPAYLMDAVRTPFGKSRGALSGIRVDDLAALPLRELLRRNPAVDAADVQDVILGDTNGAGEDNRDVARMAVLLADLPVTVPGVTVNRLCGSGAEAIVQAARAVAAGDLDTVVAGGVEGMSRAPFVLAPIDSALPRSAELHGTAVGWRMVNPRFPATWTASLGRSAERMAEELGVDRQEQDAWAVRSHERAAAAWAEGLHDDVVLPTGGLERDESIRPGTSMQTLQALRPAFSADGSVTAGNSSPINDGAIAALVVSERRAAELPGEPIARIVGSAVVGCEPDRFALAPVDAIETLLRRLDRRPSDVAVLELNEAFAAQVLACLRRLPAFDPEVVNPHGGAIAMGHPLGASGARVLVDCARHVRRRGGGLGIMAACIGVGQGIAVAVQA